ncbi:MAG: zinc-binding dehydrogenase [Planctomycetes bacterium]|nr:zinc-binding dehydrogenase [Planctomycetota bacterium]
MRLGHVDQDRAVLDRTDGVGVDVVVETGGSGTLERSLRATRPGGTVAFLGAITGLRSMLDVAPILMKRLHVAGIYVDSRRSFENLNRFLTAHRIKPVIDRTFSFEQLSDALLYMQAGAHFGKIVVEY